MLRSLHADADAQAHLTTFMQLPLLAQLYNTCKLWRRWIILPQQSGHGHAMRSVHYTAESLPQMLRCAWLLQTVTEIDNKTRDPRVKHHTEPEKLSGQQQLVRFLQSLPQFVRLDSLLLHFESAFLPPPPQLHSLLLPATGRLRSLTLKPFKHNCTVGLQAFCAHLALFADLETLCLAGDLVHSSWMDLSALPTLKSLHTFRFDSCYHEQVTVAQAAHLAQCRTLTSLEFGAWGPRNGEVDHVDALTIFVNSRFANDGPASTSNSAALTPIATLTDFMFLHNELTAAGWTQLSRLTSLKTSLYLTLHDLDITEDDWTRLGQFTQLTELHISSPNPIYDLFNANSPALNLDHVLPPILQMCALNELRISRCNVQLQHIASLVALPVLRLTVIAQCHLCVEDLAVVSAVCTSQRRVWVVGTSFGDKRTQVQNCTLPEELRSWR